ncbi:MAG: nucleotidyltransferase domain-containing protein [Thiotrichaceae bacterium]
MNTTRQDSDIDLLVEFEPEQKSFDHFMQLCDLLEHNLPYPVEVMTTESLSPYIKPHILKEVEYVTITP